MRLSRKLKKKVIKVFGRGTYIGIISNVLSVSKYHNNKGVLIKYTDKFTGSPFYYDGQYNPYITLPNINKPKQR